MTFDQPIARIIVHGFLAVGTALLWYVAASQANLLSHSQKVRARIVSSEVSQSTHRGKTTYGPNVHFQIETPAAAVKEGNQIYPELAGGTERWSQSMVDRFPPGLEVDAYISNTSPPVAYLLHEATVGPYLLLEVWAVIWLVLAWRTPRSLGRDVGPVDLIWRGALMANIALIALHGVWVMSFLSR